MSSLEAMDHRLTFDDILEAVQESKRGRWFLKEFEQRLQKQDTSSILQAISKLEARMDGFGAQAGQPAELVKVKAAIANARNDLLKLGVGKDAMSSEGRMFAELAEMARKAMPASTESSAGVMRTLQLVAEIETTVAPLSAAEASSKFFSADENLFERPAAQPKPLLVSSTPVAVVPAESVVQPNEQAAKPAAAPRKEEPVATGAKLIIRKTSSAEVAPMEQPAPPASEVVAEAAVDTPPPQPMATETPEITSIDTPRIVIIRRKAEDMPEVDAVSAA
jgi:hypothetical protein